MKRKKEKITLSENRVVLSDTLPFETPITFSNRSFYRFLNTYDVHYNESRVFWIDDEIANVLVPLLLGGEVGAVCRECLFRKGHEREYNSIPCKNPKVPFSYPVPHPSKEYRLISIPHPASQLSIVDFYSKYDQSILYYCSISNYSVRYPIKCASQEFCTLNVPSIKDKFDDIENFKKEYESLMSFFSYKTYSNIYKIYDSHRYFRCEKKYNSLLKLDISRCFDSIYTHSLSWAIYSKKFVKNSKNFKSIDTSFAGKFDSCMQKMNYNETNGILVGPEFSRLFAEIILQRVDREVEKTLFNEHQLKNKVHYEILRYVDDYFIFFNDEQHEVLISNEISKSLCEYKLFLNKDKKDIFQKPIITPLSIAKRKISKLLEALFEITYDESHENIVYKKYDSGNIISDYKAILKITNASYADVLNYTLVLCENMLLEQLSKLKVLKQKECTKEVKDDILTYLNMRIFIIYFLYTVNPTINTSIRLSRIILFIKEELKSYSFSSFDTEDLDRQIFESSCSVMKYKAGKIHRYIENSYMLSVIKSLGRMYRLSERDLAHFFGIKNHNNKYSIEENNKLNYFAISSLLYYIGGIKRYSKIKQALYKEIQSRLSMKKESLLHAENTFLLFDTISYPFFSNKEKDRILRLFSIEDQNLRTRIIKNPALSFSKWNNFNPLEELVAKKSFEVY